MRQLGPEGGRVSSFEDPGSHSYIRFRQAALLPLQSNAHSSGRTCCARRNVQLTESGLIYYHDPTSGAALPPSNLGHILTLQYWDEPEQTLNVRTWLLVGFAAVRCQQEAHNLCSLRRCRW